MIGITSGNISAMSGLMLAQFEDPKSDIQMSVDIGSWFGNVVVNIPNRYNIPSYYNLTIISFYISTH